MKAQRTTAYDDPFWIRWLFHLSIALPILILTINAHDSTLAKTPVLVLGSTLVLALLLANRIRRGRTEYQPSEGDLPAIAFLIFAWCSLLYTVSVPSSHAEVLRISACVALFFAVQHLISTRRQVEFLTAAIAVVAAIVCIVGFVQYFFADKLAMEFYIGEARRVGSTLGNPTFLGGYIALVLPLCVSQAFSTRSRQRWVYGFLAAALGALLIFTQSRSALIATAVALTLLVALSIRSRRVVISLLAVSAVAGLLIMFLLAPQLAHRFEGILDSGPTSTLARRVFFWEAGLKAFLAAPLTGHGIGTFERVMVHYRSPEYWTVKSEDIVPHAHNEFLEIGAELGIIGLALCCWLLWKTLRTACSIARHEDEWKRFTAIGIMCGLLGVLLDNLSGVSLRQTPVLMLMWLFAGVLFSRGFRATQKQSRTFSLNVPPALAFAPIVAWIVFLIAYAPRQIDILRADAHYMRAVLSQVAGRPDVALGELHTASQLNPGSYLVRSNLALELLKGNQPGKARDVIDSLLQDYPLYPKAHLVRSVANLALLETPAALRDIGVERMHRTHPEVYYVESLIHQERRDSVAERSALQQQIAACLRGGTPTHLGHACTRLRMLTPHDSLRALEQTLQQLSTRFPAERSVVENLSLVHRLMGDTATADSILRPGRVQQ